MDIAGKVFVVTGAGNGIGREVALELLRRGASVAGLDIKPAWLTATKELAGAAAERFLSIKVDLGSRRSISSVPKKVHTAFGPADGVVNVAGIIQPFVRVAELEDVDIDRVMAVNFTGPLALIRAFLPDLTTRPEACITNVSSMGSYAPVPGQTVYGASKAALNLLSEGLRSELRETKVKVTVVYPGAIGTNIAQNSGIDVPSGGTDAPERSVVPADEAGAQIVEAIAQDRRRILIGSDATTMWWANRVSPDLAGNLIYQGMKDLLK